ncbi:MAG: bifunctional precorrin-2 dehydrogenase/sirohydrochlorin ferrochelatase [Planctomycetota bacterium]|nr:bifunctional precorrin-2 dehydrogenase/sirohydrochlorin ferrochelatase [Planctomycetota bacterium]
MFVEMAGKRCLVVGGGKAAFEKASKLLQAGAEVVVVALEFARDFSAIPPDARKRLRREARGYAPGEAGEYDFIVAASGDAEVDLRVFADANRAGRTTNIASLDDGGGCMLGADLRRGDLVVSVSTGGASPSLAASLRDLVGETVTPWHGMLANAFGRVKARLREGGYPVATRRSVLRRLAAPVEWSGIEAADTVDDLEAVLWKLAEILLAGMDREAK